MHTTSCSPTALARGAAVVAARTSWRAFGRDTLAFAFFVAVIAGGVGALVLLVSIFVPMVVPTGGQTSFDGAVFLTCMASIPAFLVWGAWHAYAATKALCALGRTISRV